MIRTFTQQAKDMLNMYLEGFFDGMTLEHTLLLLALMTAVPVFVTQPVKVNA